MSFSKDHHYKIAGGNGSLSPNKEWAFEIGSFTSDFNQKNYFSLKLYHVQQNKMTLYSNPNGRDYVSIEEATHIPHFEVLLPIKLSARSAKLSWSKDSKVLYIKHHQTTVSYNTENSKFIVQKLDD